MSEFLQPCLDFPSAIHSWADTSGIAGECLDSPGYTYTLSARSYPLRMDVFTHTCAEYIVNRGERRLNEHHCQQLSVMVLKGADCQLRARNVPI